MSLRMRGTGCSGGAFDYFEKLQRLDGYDVIETVAAQPWVKGGKVGMVGLSYPGIAQLFVASTRPPHLAAITPMSTFDDTARGVVAPGGIFNTGFALKGDVDLSATDLLRVGAEIQRYRLDDWWPASGGGMWPNTFWNTKVT